MGQPTIEFRLDTLGMPHTYVVINNGSGNLQMYGFAPAIAGSAWGAGHVFNEAISGPASSPHPYNWTTGPIALTTEQFNRVVNEINSSIENPPYYNLPASFLYSSQVNQCATWANGNRVTTATGSGLAFCLTSPQKTRPDPVAFNPHSNTPIPTH
jgi:hypothetical protein